MKKIFLTLLAPLAIACMSCGEKETSIVADSLPAKAKTFISTNWPSATIASATKDRDDGTIEYNVVLSDATKLEFDKKGNWESVDNPAGIPTGFIPTAIVDYVTTHYASQIITDINVDKHGYDVELDNHLDLEFDKNGKFLRLD